MNFLTVSLRFGWHEPSECRDNCPRKTNSTDLDQEFYLRREKADGTIREAIDAICGTE
jgi:hypothetical protein